MPQPDIMTVEEVAAYLRVAERTVYEWAQKGEIPCGKLGASWRFRRADIDAWVNDRLNREKRSGALDTDLQYLLRPAQVKFLSCRHKAEALESLSAVLAGLPGMPGKKEIFESVKKREALMSTGVGLGLGVPHVRVPGVRELALAVGICRAGLSDYDSLDNQPVRLVFLILAGLQQHAEYLRLLAQISGRLKDDALRESLLQSADAEDFCRRLSGGPA